VRGERSTSQLLLEPQNQFLAKGTSAPEINISSGNDGSSATGTSAALIGKSGNEMHLPVARELLPLVQQQLHTLETHQLTWVGQVWQGQQMQWEIQGQPERHAPQPEEREWSTEMELALPKLGDVHARLVFSANGVKLNLRAADSATVALFNQSMSKLQAALADINIPLAAAVVEKS
jgi:flagellar hook-length control protein FliK